MLLTSEGVSAPRAGTGERRGESGNRGGWCEYTLPSSLVTGIKHQRSLIVARLSGRQYKGMLLRTLHLGRNLSTSFHLSIGQQFALQGANSSLPLGKMYVPVQKTFPVSESTEEPGEGQPGHAGRTPLYCQRKVLESMWSLLPL